MRCRCGVRSESHASGSHLRLQSFCVDLKLGSATIEAAAAAAASSGSSKQQRQQQASSSSSSSSSSKQRQQQAAAAAASSSSSKQQQQQTAASSSSSGSSGTYICSNPVSPEPQHGGQDVDEQGRRFRVRVDVIFVDLQRGTKNEGFRVLMLRSRRGPEGLQP